MAGIYIHIPFCKKACHYCNFHFSTSLKQKNEFTHALLKEIELQSGYLSEQNVDTIYFGGGTPSLLSNLELDSIITAIRSNYKVAPDLELTLEANPDDVSIESIGHWTSAGINRVSLGVQSFFEDDLRWMNRAHDAAQSMNSIKLLQQNGISNLSIDLIYGSPTLSDQQWKQNVDTAIELQIPHLSCYALTVESKTALATMIKKRQLADVVPENQARQFQILMDWTENKGYEHYEISNFAKPGHRSRHNSSYWKGYHYLGLGPSAHSFNGSERQWNVANNSLYIQSIQNGLIPFEKELLNNEQQFNEYIMTAIRTMEGIDLSKIISTYGNEMNKTLNLRAIKFIESGKIIKTGQHLILSRDGKLFADGIAADLFAD